MRPKLLFVYSFITLIGGFGYGQQMNFANYSIEYGLNSSFTTSITQDNHGFIWVATAGGGVNKFDGLKFQSYNKKHGLGSNIIFQVACDSQGYIWALSDSSLIKMKGNELSHIEVDSSRSDHQYLLVLDASDNAWVATARGGIYKIVDGNSVYYDSLQGFTRSMVEDVFQRKDGSLTFTTKDGLFTYADHRFDRLKLNGTKDAIINNFFEDREGNFWLSTSLGLRFQAHGTDTLLGFASVKALEGRNIYTMAQDKEGNIWMGSDRGVVLFQEGNFQKFDEDEGFTNNPVNDVFIDNHGNVWFSTWGFGLYKFHKTSFVNYDKQFGLHHEIIKGILVDRNNNIWFGLHAHGIDKYDGNVITNYSVESGHLPHNKISVILEDFEGNLWFGTRGGGLLKFANGTFKVFNDKNSGLIGNDIYSSLEDSKHNLWIGTVQGFSKYTNGSFKNYSKPGTTGKVEFPIMSIAEMPDGRILIGSTSGMYLVEGDNLVAFNPELGLSNYSIHSVAVKDNILWIGTWGSGIGRIDLTTHEKVFITAAQGLDSDLIYSIKFDAYDDLWVGTTLGLSKISFNQDGNIKQIRKYTPTDGFYGKSLSSDRSIYIANDGTIWICSMHGAHRYVRENDNIDKQPPLTQITSLDLFNTYYDWASKGATNSWFNLPDNVELKHNENHLTFNFIGLSYFNPQNVSYSFKLDNFDAEWSPPTRNAFATYSNLPPGSYVFNVIAGNGQGVWNTNATTYALTIQPAFWQTSWFYGLCAFITFGLLAFLWKNYKTRHELNKRLSINKAKELAILNTRKKMAQDFQHEIGNKLAGILVSSNVLQKQLETSNNGVEAFARKIEINSKGLFEDVKDFIWTIDPNNDNLVELYNYIKEYGEKRFKENTEFISKVNLKTLRPITLDSNLNRQIIWIFKKMVDLTSNDASCEYACLNLKQHPTHFVISYRYNGQVETVSDQNLIKEVKKRAKKVEAQVSFGKCSTDQELQEISFISHHINHGINPNKHLENGKF